MMYIFCFLSWGSLSLIRGSYFNMHDFNKKLKKDKFQFWSQNRMPKIPHEFRQFWQHLSCSFEKKNFLSVVIVSVNRRGKDKVTFVSFGLRAGRFTVECPEYGNTLFSYFDIIIKVSSNFFWIQGLQSIYSIT